MSTLHTMGRSPFLDLLPVSGLSATSQIVDSAVNTHASRCGLEAASGLPRKRALDLLRAAYDEGRQEDWNGRGAVAIGEAAYWEALRFLLALPADIPLPEPAPDPEGEIGFEWFLRKGHSYLVTFAGTGTIAYAGMFGPASDAHGSEVFIDVVPEQIQQQLRRLLDTVAA